MSGDEFLEQVPQYTLNTLDDGTEEKLLLVVQLPGIQRADQLVVRIWEDNIFIHAEGRYRLDLDLDVRIEDKPAGLRFVKKKAVLKAEFLVCPSPPGAPTKAGRGSASSQASRGEVHDSFLADALKLRDGARASPGRGTSSSRPQAQTNSGLNSAEDATVPREQQPAQAAASDSSASEAADSGHEEDDPHSESDSRDWEPGSVAGAASERKASEPVDPILRARKDDSASRRRDLQPESSGDLYEEAKAQANKEAAREWHARAVAAAQASDLEGAVRMLKKANSISGGEYAVDLAKAEQRSGFGTARPEAEDESEDDSTDEAHKFEGQRPGESAPHFWLRFARAFAWACLLLMWQSGIQPLWRRAPYTLPRICRLLGAPRAAQWIMDQLLAGSGAAFHALRLLAGVVALALAGVALLLAGHVLYWAWLLLSVVLLFTFWQPHWWATAALAATIAYQRQSTLLSMFWSFPLAWYKAAVPLVVIVAVFVLYCTYIRMDADESSSGGGNLKSEVLRGAEGEVKRILAATDHYMVLEVARDADEAAIRKAKKVKALQSHPDKLGGAVGAKEAFQRVTAASELLSNPAKRRAYDRELAVREYKAQQAQRSRGGGGGASSSTSSAEVDARTDFAAAACEAAAAGGYAFDGNIPQNIKMAAPPLLIACVNCRKDHLCFAVDVPREAARYCSHCNTRHAAHDGQGWLEKDGFFSWKAYCCSRGEIYEITHWAQCSRAVYDPDTGSRYPCDSHTPALNFQAGGRPGGAGGARGGGRRGTPQHAPQPQAQQTPRGGKRRKGGRRR
ncbi:hypothetical protein WJX72_011210 [[Myrmecia] bisecta]|uniref:J domain-containing protein n=1 Tax=[Myrmecia] bisecta TaxID=41462 RepID=A0AAW1R9X3_9CHLO